ncbi:hypothetical protein [Pontivivens ytuae]|uniref:Uncharacterized protein n=1 Tax=Pontivivens ytuae TaxID=2789856 RepID=A0A7S9LR41_9RHOB|nr:hypothetical protein [Pontivivens ytuae]QPH53713.1 hypothetical protein I0K15_18335 [Pontivivens ytuae]
MKISQVIAAMLLATGASAEEVALDRVLSVLTGPEIDVLDWNGDGYPDRALLVLRKDEAAADLVLLTTDPASGRAAVSDRFERFLPLDASPPGMAFGTVSLGLNVVSDISDVDLIYLPVLGRSGLQFLGVEFAVLREGWTISNVRVQFQPGSPVQSCDLVFAMGEGRILTDEGLQEIALDAEPKVADWGFDQLPEPCRFTAD